MAKEINIGFDCSRGEGLWAEKVVVSLSMGNVGKRNAEKSLISFCGTKITSYPLSKEIKNN